MRTKILRQCNHSPPPPWQGGGGEWLRLFVPRVIVDGMPHEIELIYGNDGRFSITSSLAKSNPSSGEASFVNSIVTLPLVIYRAGGKVRNLRRDNDGKFSLVTSDIHPDTQVP